MIGIGAFLGANVRYLVSMWSGRRHGAVFPYGTVIVNLAGCLLIGVFLGILTARFDIHSNTRLLVATGFLGAETTYSAFAYESLSLWRDRQFRLALVNIGISIVPGLAGTALGLAIADIVTAGVS